MHNQMAWRPYANLIDGELDNRVPGKVTGSMRFFRNGKPPLDVSFDLAGDFHEDIRGKMIRLRNPKPSDECQDGEGTYMDGFARVQRGTVGDITAGLPLGPWTSAIAEKLMAQNEIFWDDAGLGQAERKSRRRECAERYRAHISAGDLFYPYIPYPYIEWYSDNGRVVLELDPSQVEIVDGVSVGGEEREGARGYRKGAHCGPGIFLGLTGRRGFPAESRAGRRRQRYRRAHGMRVPSGRSCPDGWAARRRHKAMDSQSVERKWLTLEDLLKRPPLKKSRVYYLVHTNQIPYHHIGRTLIFDYDEIVRWVQHDGDLGISRKAS